MDDFSPPLFGSGDPDIAVAPKAKKPKAAGKKPAAPKVAKAKKPVATKPKKARPPKRPNKPVKVIAKKPVKKAKAAAPAVVRSERLDLRLSKREKAMLRAKAVKLRRTLTSIFIEFVEKLK